MIKVLHFYKTYSPNTRGGVEQFINQLIRGTTALKVDSEVLCLTLIGDDGVIDVDGHTVHQSPLLFEIASTPFSFSVIKKYKQLVRDADIIHYHYPYPFSDLLHLFLRIKKPYVVTYHSDIVKQKTLLKLYNPLKNWFLKQAAYVVATSPNYVKSSDVLSKLSIKPEIVPIGLDRDTYPKPKPEMLEYWRLKYGNKFFLFVGALRYYKGLRVLIDAAENADYPILILGVGPMETELIQYVKSKKISNVYFLGSLSEADKVSLFMLCHAVVFPSHLRSEAFGITLLEGAMLEKPLISCDISTGTTYVNIHMETGLVVAPKNPISLREAMDYLWENPLEAKAMGVKAKARFDALFTAKLMSESYTRLYEKVLANKTKII